MTDIVDRAAVVLLGLVAGSLAEAQDRLTLVDAVTRALSYYPSLQASVAQVEAADATLDEAESRSIPDGERRREREPLPGADDGSSHPRLQSRRSFLPSTRTSSRPARTFVTSCSMGAAVPRASMKARPAGRAPNRRFSKRASGSFRRSSSNTCRSSPGRGPSKPRTARSRRSRPSSPASKQVFDVGRAATVDVLRVEASIAAARAERVRLASSLDLAQRNLARLVGVEEPLRRVPRTSSLSRSPGRCFPLGTEILRNALESSPKDAPGQRRAGGRGGDASTGAGPGGSRRSGRRSIHQLRELLRRELARMERGRLPRLHGIQRRRRYRARSRGRCRRREALRND